MGKVMLSEVNFVIRIARILTRLAVGCLSLIAALPAGLHATEMRARLFSMGSAPVHGTPEQFGAFIRSEIAKWGKVVKESGAKIDD